MFSVISTVPHKLVEALCVAGISIRFLFWGTGLREGRGTCALSFSTCYPRTAYMLQRNLKSNQSSLGSYCILVFSIFDCIMRTVFTCKFSHCTEEQKLFNFVM